MPVLDKILPQQFLKNLFKYLDPMLGVSILDLSMGNKISYCDNLWYSYIGKNLVFKIILGHCVMLMTFFNKADMDKIKVAF